jgi:antitoxin PrlF
MAGQFENEISPGGAFPYNRVKVRRIAMPTATLTSKGQTTLPVEVRKFLRLTAGDKIEFKLNPGDNTVTLKAANIDALSLRGMLKNKKMKPYTANERVMAFRNRVRKK